jgi:hypothetical protein
MKTISVLVTTFFIFYLFGSFAAASFNIKEWDESLRAFIAIFGGTMSIGLSVLYYFIEKIKS